MAGLSCHLTAIDALHLDYRSRAAGRLRDLGGDHQPQDGADSDAPDVYRGFDRLLEDQRDSDQIHATESPHGGGTTR
jgi:hypothetical protein